MAIEFGADHRPTSTVFASGSGANQEARKAQSHLHSMLGVKLGKCRSCGTAYVAGRGDAGRCTPCLSAEAHVKINGGPVSALDMMEDGTVQPSARKGAGVRPSAMPPSPAPLEKPLGADTLEDWV